MSNIKEIQEQIHEDLEISKKSDDTEDHVDTALYGPLSMVFAHFCIRTGISANAVTVLSLVLGVCGSVFFYPKNLALNLVGIIIEYFSVVLDSTDGEVARLTHTGSQLGRFLDGLVDSLNFLAVYIALGFRMTTELIPFTGRKWGMIIWIVIIVSGLFHAEQARMADYYRTLHLNFLHRDKNSDFISSDNIKAELAASKDTPLYNRIYLAVYYLYTSAQESRSPNMRRLINKMAEQGDALPDDLYETYTAKSRKYVQLTNVLTFNLRAYTLYLLVLLRLHPFFFPFNIIVLTAIEVYMVVRYEKIAKETYHDLQGFSGS